MEVDVGVLRVLDNAQLKNPFTQRNAIRRTYLCLRDASLGIRPQPVPEFVEYHRRIADLVSGAVLDVHRSAL